ncbi:MAG TPA: TraB/GumN family protein [Brumimicrobium sp.]|nr:TraB/GumN family protein [Brumimicrobium sp.]
MRYIFLFLFTALNFISFGQHKEIDRSNYQLLWKISRADMSESSYLFGTYHSNDTDVFDFPDALFSILENADAVVLEADITEMMLDETIHNYELDYRKSDILHWVIPARGADNVTYTAYGSDNGRPQFIDMYFKQVADNCKKVFIPLESIQDQMKIGTKNEIDPHAPSNIKTLSRNQLKQKYLEGNANDLHKYTKNSTLHYIDLYKDLIVDRNINMVAGIDTIIHQFNSTFIAVGAAHLLGEQGIVPLLKAKGYTIELVKSDFTSQTKEQKLLKECTHYEYADERYGAEINFTGKPAVLDYKSSGSRKVKYVELGQGNTYGMGMYHYSYKTNLDSVVMSYFDSKEFQILNFDSIMVDKNTKAYQGRIQFDGKSQWMRVFHRNNILYEIYAYGGHRFMNSNRSQTFFNSFKFKHFDSYNDNDLSATVYSTSKTMRLSFPKGAMEETRQEEYDHVWSALWFNPSAEETFFALESTMTDNTIFYDNENYGNYLLKGYHPDSIDFYGEKHSEGAYLQKSFTVRDNDKETYGKMRVLGNVIQLIEYSGKNKNRRDTFLGSFDSIHPYSKVKNEIKIINNTFSTTLTKSGFKKQEVKPNNKYSTAKEYILNDTENSITYHVLVEDYKAWAFSQKSAREILNSQITWPNKVVSAITDTVYDLSNKHPSLNFDIYYPTSENRFIGKTMLIGKSIVTVSATYPNFAHHVYQNLSFLDSLTFFIPESTPLNTISIPLLKNEIMVNGEEGVDQLIIQNHISDSLLNTMLLWPTNFWESFDPMGGLQGSILIKLIENGSDIDVMNYWQENVNQSNIYLTLAALHVTELRGNSTDFISIVKESKNKGLQELNYYRYIEISEDNTAFLKSVWPVFSPLLEDSMAWSTSFIIPELLKDEFFYTYFTSKKFIHAITDKKQPPWAAFRYLELMHEHGIPKDLFLDVLKKWSKNKNDHTTGSIAAWKTILNEKISLKERRLIKKDAAVAISYSKVMAVSETPVFDLLSYEEMIGYLSFDHYKDAYFDKSKKLNHIENRALSKNGEVRNFALYKAVENGRTYFMARELFSNKVLPSYGGFGNDTYFIFKEGAYNPEVITNELIKKLLEKEN